MTESAWYLRVYALTHSFLLSTWKVNVCLTPISQMRKLRPMMLSLRFTQFSVRQSGPGAASLDTGHCVQGDCMVAPINMGWERGSSSPIWNWEQSFLRPTGRLGVCGDCAPPWRLREEAPLPSSRQRSVAGVSVELTSGFPVHVGAGLPSVWLAQLACPLSPFVHGRWDPGVGGHVAVGK